MFLNNTPEFMAAHGYSSYSSAKRAAFKVLDLMPRGNRPLYICVARMFTNGKTDLVNVLVLSETQNKLDYIREYVADKKFHIVVV